MDVMGIISTIMGTVNKFVPDGDKQIQIEAELQKLVATSNFQLLIRQADIGVEEAKNNAGGPRKMFMYCATAGVVYQLMLQPFLTGVLRLFDLNPQFPQLDMSVILKMLAWMFGIG